MSRSTDQMTRQWDELARLNAPYSIVSTEAFEADTPEALDAFWASGREQVERILDSLQLGGTRDATMVEIGCGIGRMTHVLAERFGRVIALDVSPEMIRRARAHWPSLSNVEFRVCEGSDLAGIPDGSVDFVFSWYVLQHIPQADHVLAYVREAGRVLKPGGRAFLHMQASRTTVEHMKRMTEKRLFYAMPESLRLALSRLRGGELDRELGARFRVWRGSVVRPGAVQRAAREAGMTLAGAEPAGKGLVAFRLQKG